MSWITISLCSVFLAIVSFLLLRQAALRRLLLQLQGEQQALSETWRAEQTELSRFLGVTPRPIITIEILNAVELAANQSRFGRLIGRYKPDMIRRQVYKHTAENMRVQMSEHGVQVEVRVHGID